MRSLTPRDEFCPYLLAFGLGIVCYVKVSFEPSWQLLTLALAGTSLLASWKKSCLILLFLVLGFSVMSYRSHQVAAPRLAADLNTDLTGLIYDLAVSDDSYQLLLTDVKIKQLASEDTPRYLKISVLKVKQTALLPGDRVKVRFARLFVNQAPITLSGYDQQFFAWFDQVGGSGFTTVAPRLLARAAGDSWLIKINRLRSHLGNLLDQSQLSDSSKRLSKAILLGHKKGLYGSYEETSLRLGGVGHILAISGLHMAFCASLVFVFLRSALAFSSHLALHYQLRKIAALGSLVFVLAYLCLSGFSVSAVRAAVMITFTLLAILVDRPPVLTRILCLSAFTILSCQPEQLFTISFQMSFLAVATISWVSSNLSALLRDKKVNKPTRYLLYALAISATTGIATSLIAVQSFHYFGLYNFVTNLLVLPLFGLLILPLVLSLAFLLPLGLEQLVAPQLDLLFTAVVTIAAFVSHLPGSYLVLPSLETHLWGLAIFLVAAALFYQGRITALLLGGGLVCFLLGWQLKPRVDLYLTNKLVALPTANEEIIYLPSPGCVTSYVKAQWQQEAKGHYYSPVTLACSEKGCQLDKLVLQLVKEDGYCGSIQLLVDDQPLAALATTQFYQLTKNQLRRLDYRPISKPWSTKKK